MSSPRVTVVVPNYNHAGFLAQRLDSIRNQTYQDFEILYLDDASTDDSAEVFASYAADPRVRSILNTVNTGSPFAQWNRGVREARGEYVWIAEADDYADPALLERLTALLEANPSVGIAYCQSQTVDAQGNILENCGDWVRFLDSRHWTSDFISSGPEECERYLSVQCTIPNASAALFRRSVFEKAGFVDERFRMCGDWALYLKILQISDLAFVAEPLNYFRRHDKSVSAASRLNGVFVRESYQVVRNFFAQRNVAPANRRRACDMRMADWRIALLSGQPLSWQSDRAIFNLARKIDNRLYLRLGKVIVELFLQKVGLRPVRQR